MLPDHVALAFSVIEKAAESNKDYDLATALHQRINELHSSVVESRRAIERERNATAQA